MRTRNVVFFRSAAFFIFVLISAITVAGARAEVQLGVEIPESQSAVRLDAVIKNPAEYNGKVIVLKGIVSGQCASLCEFFFRDGIHTATIYPQGFNFPKLKRNNPVTIYAQVISGEEQVIFSALGLKME